jgi:hypothetical protein
MGTGAIQLGISNQPSHGPLHPSPLVLGLDPNHFWVKGKKEMPILKPYGVVASPARPSWSQKSPGRH